MGGATDVSSLSRTQAAEMDVVCSSRVLAWKLFDYERPPQWSRNMIHRKKIFKLVLEFLQKTISKNGCPFFRILIIVETLTAYNKYLFCLAFQARRKPSETVNYAQKNVLLLFLGNYFL